MGTGHPRAAEALPGAHLGSVLQSRGCKVVTTPGGFFESGGHHQADVKGRTRPGLFWSSGLADQGRFYQAPELVTGACLVHGLWK